MPLPVSQFTIETEPDFGFAVQYRRRGHRCGGDPAGSVRGRAGRGLGRQLYGELFTALRQLGYVSAFAGITLPNPASVGLQESLGFEPIGTFPSVGFKHGRWHDVGWWRLLLTNPPEQPRPPRPWLSGNLSS